MVGLAEPVAGPAVLPIHDQAVVDCDCGEGWQDPGVVHRDPTAFGVEVEQRPGVGAGDVDPVQPAGDPPTGLVEVSHLSGGQLLADDGQEPLQAGGCVGEQGGRPARRDRRPECLLQAFGGAVHGQVLMAQQIRPERGDTRSLTPR